MEDNLLVTKLNILCAQKDIELASLKREMLVAQLRKQSGASDGAEYHAPSFTFIEPPAPDLADPA